MQHLLSTQKVGSLYAYQPSDLCSICVARGFSSVGFSPRPLSQICFSQSPIEPIFMEFTMSFNAAASDLYLACFVPWGDSCRLPCAGGIELIISRSFHQTVPCLNMPENKPNRGQTLYVSINTNYWARAEPDSNCLLDSHRSFCRPVKVAEICHPPCMHIHRHTHTPPILLCWQCSMQALLMPKTFFLSLKNLSLQF